jgi:hypothetical protein
VAAPSTVYPVPSHNPQPVAPARSWTTQIAFVSAPQPQRVTRATEAHSRRHRLLGSRILAAPLPEPLNTPIRGGAVVQGVAPVVRVSLTAGGATAGGRGPVARVATTAGGVIAQGRAPSAGELAAPDSVQPTTVVISPRSTSVAVTGRTTDVTMMRPTDCTLIKRTTWVDISSRATSVGVTPHEETDAVITPRSTDAALEKEIALAELVR